MATLHAEKHPTELLGLSIDTPKPGLPREAAAVVEGTYQKMKCYNQVTGQLVGFLGSSGNNADIVQDEKEAASLAWSSYNSDLYLRKDTSPNDRFLGLGWHGYACWGLAGGWNDAVIYNSDQTISLKSDPKRKLYIYGAWVCWSEGESNQNILRFVF